MSKKILNSPIERFTRILFSRVIERLAVIVSVEELSFSQVATLHIIDREDFVNVNDVSSRLNLSMSATSRMIEELVKKNLVDRTEDQENRRAKILKLTENGKIFMNKLSIERVKIIEDTATSISSKVPIKILKIVSSKFFTTKREG